jgi:hypothetical protein
MYKKCVCCVRMHALGASYPFAGRKLQSIYSSELQVAVGTTAIPGTRFISFFDFYF